MIDPVFAKWQQALSDLTDDNADRRIAVKELRRLVEMAGQSAARTLPSDLPPLYDDGKPVLPEGYEAPLDPRSTRLLINERQRAARSLPAETMGEEQRAVDFVQAMAIVQRGFDAWKNKPHNARWFRKIDGTPIPNDLCVNIAEAICDSPEVRRLASRLAAVEQAAHKFTNPMLENEMSLMQAHSVLCDAADRHAARQRQECGT